MIEEQNSTPWDSLNHALGWIFSSSTESYSITKDIANYIYEKEFDGIVYPSYFQQVSIHNLNHVNYAIFGTPIRDKKLNVVCINKINISRVTYEFILGPLI
jgi:hypothetical protein